MMKSLPVMGTQGPTIEKPWTSGDGVPLAVNYVEGELTIRETAIIYIRESDRAASEAPILKGADEGMPLHPEEKMVMESTLGENSVSARQEEASSSKAAADASPADEDRETGVIVKGDESGFDMDPDDHRMIDEGLT